MIQITDAVVRYGKHTILNGVSLTAQSGAITVVLGRNGCGKTTLMRAVTGGIGYGGSVCVDGRQVRDMKAEQRARLVAMMPQMLARPNISVARLVSFGRHPYTGFSGTLSEGDRRRVTEVLRVCGIEEIGEKLVSHISGGERQKAYFAMLLAQDTPNIILDEPCAHLDAIYRRRVSDFMRKEKAAGKTVLAVFHDVDHALEVADCICVIDKAQVAFCGTGEEFKAGGLPEAVFGLTAYRCTAPDGAERVLYR